MKILIIGLIVTVFTSSQSIAHDGNHETDSVKTDTTMVGAQSHGSDPTHNDDHEMAVKGSKVEAGMEDFPTLHPLIVHFAIVLIIVAAGMQLVNLWLLKPELAWITGAILLAGVLAAWLASKNFHPHTHGLTAQAQAVLDQHDKWADWTINSGLIALVLQVTNLFVFKGKRWAAGMVALVLLVSSYSVSRAGHYGSQLVHIEGVGPQGKFLEMDH